MIAAIHLAFRAEVRRRWRSWLSVALIVAIIGGVVTGLVAAGRRTADAFPRLLSYTNGADALVYSANGFGFPPASIGHLPQVVEAGVFAFPQQQISLGGKTLPTSWQLVAPASGSAGTTIQRERLLQGHFPNPDSLDQAAVSYNQPNGVRIGSTLEVRFYKPSQASELFDSFGPVPVAKGAVATLHVVGVEANPQDFPAGGSAEATLYVTPALLHEIAPSSAVAYAAIVRLRGRGATLSSFVSAVAHLGGGSELYVDGVDGSYAAIERSIHLQAVAWWILAAIAGLAGLIVIAQLLTRQLAVEAAEFPILSTIGMGGRDLFLLGLLSTVTVAFVGAVGALAIAYLLSPLTPLGEAAVAEPYPGFAFDTVALVLGSIAVFVAVATVGAVPALREATRRRALGDNSWATAPRPSSSAAVLARAGASVAAVVGTRLAFERGRGQGAVPTLAAFVGATLAVVALVGTSVYGASLGHLLATPRLYGGGYDLQMENPGGTITTIVPALLAYKDISQLSTGVESAVRIRGLVVDTIAEVSERGPLLTPPVISGRAVDGAAEIVLGETTLRQVGAQIGEVVPVSVGPRTMSFKVVGTAAFPVFGNNSGLGNGAYMSLASYDRLAGCKPGETTSMCIVDGAVLNLRPGPQSAVTLARLETAYGNGVAPPVVPNSLVNFGQSADLPLVLGLAVGLFGAATLLHFLLVSLARRRRDTGVLKTLGLIRRQVGEVVLFQASTVVVVALVIGVPLGLVTGRFAWDMTATGFGVIPVVVVPVFEIVTIVVGSVIAVNLLALAPAALSSRLAPAPLLRAQ